MYFRTVYIEISINREKTSIPIDLSCSSETPKEELMKRAHKALKEALKKAKYIII
jgi:hypothetical protein